MFEDAPENTREKKVDKERDVWATEKRSSTNSRSSTSASSQGSQGRNQQQKRSRADFFM